MYSTQLWLDLGERPWETVYREHEILMRMPHIRPLIQWHKKNLNTSSLVAITKSFHSSREETQTPGTIVPDG